MYDLIERALAEVLINPPCGPNLDYNEEFLELETMTRPVTTPLTTGERVPRPDWKWVELSSVSLLDRSKDLRIAVIVVRAWVFLHGVAGLAAGLGLVLSLLERYWSCVHPQLDPEDNNDPTMRINSLAALTHHEWLLADLRGCTLTWEAFDPITVHDLELAVKSDGTAGNSEGRYTQEEIILLLREESSQRPQLGEDINHAFRCYLDLQRLLIDRFGPGSAPDLRPLGNIIEALRRVSVHFEKPPIAEDDASMDVGAEPFTVSAHPREHSSEPFPARQPVLLGVTAPRAVQAGEKFSMRFVAYAQILEARIKQILTGLDGDRSNPVLGLVPERMAAWRAGTPVTVRLSGEQVRITPAECFFEWSGSYNLVSFSVTAESKAPAGPIQLLFEAFIEAVPIVSIPLNLEVGISLKDDTQITTVAVPKTAFASYATADAAIVATCLSTLVRWDPGLKVFMDCLDLTPNEAWRNELEHVIAQVDAFMLFWSKHAMTSPWVNWEWQMARDKKGIGFIRPFPLDDPTIAPPPDELKHLHFRDRYLMARNAMLRLTDEIRNR